MYSFMLGGRDNDVLEVLKYHIEITRVLEVCSYTRVSYTEGWTW